MSMLNHLSAETYAQIAATTQTLSQGLLDRARAHGLRVACNHVCGMFGIFFDVDRVEHFEHVSNSNVERFNRFFHGMLDRGVYLAPSAFETGFVSSTHDASVIQATLDVADEVFATL
ncbi:MAG: hypothetical protein GXP16_14520 [Gammaproteobacteria bacterium]|nr:hypothetical protein [Gammaproteobacteria bacterium]